MRGKVFPRWLCLPLLFAAAAARADEIRLKDGTKIIGTIVGFENDSFRVETSLRIRADPKRQGRGHQHHRDKKEPEPKAKSSTPPQPPPLRRLPPRSCHKEPELPAAERTPPAKRSARLRPHCAKIAPAPASASPATESVAAAPKIKTVAAAAPAPPVHLPPPPAPRRS